MGLGGGRPRVLGTTFGVPTPGVPALCFARASVAGHIILNDKVAAAAPL